MRINSKVSNLERERILIGWGLWHQYPRERENTDWLGIVASVSESFKKA